MQTTLVIIPTYNEVDNVAALLDKLIELAFDLDVLVVDDNSPDGTAALVARYSEKYPQVKLCLRKKKMGLGSAYREGFAWALANRYDYVVQMDGDFSHSPEELPRLLKASQTSDITIGSRFCNGRSRKCEMNVYRYTLSWLANGYARFFLGKQIHDWTSGYRVYRSGALNYF